MRGERPSSDGVITNLTNLRNGLLTLHKILLDSERGVYERDVKRIETAGEMLALVLHDPWFDWLHELSFLVVAIDEALAAEEAPGAEEAGRLIAEARSLLMPAEEVRGFRGRYYEAIQRDPDVVIAHGRMMRVLGGMAQTPA